MGTAQVPPTPENVAETFTAGDNDFLDGDGWKLSLTAKENVVSIGVTPYDEDGNPVDEVHFRAVVVEGEETPVLLAGPAYVNGDDGYPALCCTACDDHIAYVTAGDDLAGLNAKVASHTCPAALSVSSGEADSTAKTIPHQLQNADFSHTCENLRIWEVGDEGGHVIALGHVDKQWMASAILTLSEVNHDKPITKVMLTDIRHTTGRIEDTPGGRFDFITRTGEGLDFKVTEWRLGSGEADTCG